MNQFNPACRNMTAVRIIEREEAGYAEIVFLESAQFYRLPKAHRAFDSIIATLHDALAKRRPVEVRLASPASNIIEDVKPADL